jgi:hypothetical protein
LKGAFKDWATGDANIEFRGIAVPASGKRDKVLSTFLRFISVCFNKYSNQLFIENLF